VFVDETYLQRILMNLLSNSSKFTVSGYVMLLLHLKEGILHVTVKDSGSGIPKSFLPQLFEPYKQVQARGAERGTGLGLSITKRLVQRMRGSISVESKYQKDQGVGAANSGSVFTLTIPIATSEHSPDPLPLNLIKPLRVAIMHDGKHRDVEGLITAWTSFGAEVWRTQVTADISSDPDTIIWADVGFLRKHHDFYPDVLRQQQHLVLVPYKDRTLLDEILGPTPPSNIIPIRKPLIWHSIVQTIIDTRKIRSAPDLNKDTKLAPKTDVVHNEAAESGKQAPVAKRRTVLLVEDNKVFQQSVY
jgi:histidine kinase/DNA gyrase B/HSP90-like ATPase